MARARRSTKQEMAEKAYQQANPPAVELPPAPWDEPAEVPAHAAAVDLPEVEDLEKASPATSASAELAPRAVELPEVEDLKQLQDEGPGPNLDLEAEIESANREVQNTLSKSVDVLPALEDATRRHWKQVDALLGRVAGQLAIQRKHAEELRRLQRLYERYRQSVNRLQQHTTAVRQRLTNTKRGGA